VVVLCRNLGSREWSFAPYSWHRQGISAVPSPAELPEGARVPVDCILVDRGSNRAVAGVRRAVPWTWVRVLQAAIYTQARAPFDPRAYDAACDRLFGLPTDALLGDALARCTVDAAPARR
jgi:hypothetical protein